MNAVENGLCFGRLDFAAGNPRYIGRIGLFAEDRERDPLLIDWRAPAARPFYLATAVSPGRGHPAAAPAHQGPGADRHRRRGARPVAPATPAGGRT